VVPGTAHLGYLLDCCALSDMDQCPGLIDLLASSLTIVSTRLVVAEWPALDPDRLASVGLTVIDETEEQLAEIAVGRPGLSLADRSALVVARDGRYTLVTNDGALHRMAGSAGISRAWAAELLPLLVTGGLIDRARAVDHVRTMRSGKAGSTQAMTLVFIRAIRRARGAPPGP